MKNKQLKRLGKILFSLILIFSSIGITNTYVADAKKSSTTRPSAKPSSKPTSSKPNAKPSSQTSVSYTHLKGENSFYDESSENGLSETASHFIAGVLKHARSFTAVCNPTVNSYKRLVPGYEAPCYVAWSTSNRSPLVRVPASRGNSTRVEVRSVDPAANPYLAMSTILAAGLDGIENKLIPANEVKSNIYVMTREERIANGIDELPSTLYLSLIHIFHQLKYY